MSHVTQPDPSVPQLESERVSHVPPEQHPAGQEVALHTQRPPEHACPATQAGLAPQVQAPVAEHVSAVRGLHAVHAAPSIPQVMNADRAHVEPEQQPVAQLVDVHPLQVPEDVQVCGLGHDSHVPPPLPQALVVSPFWHTPLASQQPVGHEVASQTHLPLEHTCPAAQAAPPPQVHLPALEQESAVMPQATHADPSGPHAETLGAAHVVPAQQPPGHDDALQTHAPPEQT